MGAACANWRGGRTKKRSGHIDAWVSPDDPLASMASGRNYIPEHRLVVARHLKRCLKSWEVVHHINGDKTDNRIGNLQLLPSSVLHNTHINKIIKCLTEENESLRHRIKVLEEILEYDQGECLIDKD